MSYSKASTDSHVGCIGFILLLGFAWTHKTLLVKIGYIAACVLVLTLVVITAILLVKWIHKVIGMRRLPSPNIIAVEDMSGLQFEEYVANLLLQNGYINVRLTEEYDYGVDIIAEKHGVRWGIQCKRYSGLVKADAVRQVVTALKIYQCDRGMVVTNSSYSKVAKRLADSNDCLLIGGERLSNLATSSKGRP